jgi:hypothetical protein
MYVCMYVFIKLLFESYRYRWRNESDSVSSFSRIYFSLFLYWLNKKKNVSINFLNNCYSVVRKEEEKTIFFLSLCHFLFTPAIQPKKTRQRNMTYVFLSFFLLIIKRNESWLYSFFNLSYARSSIFFSFQKLLYIHSYKSVS